MFRTSRWWARELARRDAQHALERAELINQICNLAGKPWTLPPRPVEDVAPPQPPDPDDETEAVT